jgi:hypothetical protein
MESQDDVQRILSRVAEGFQNRSSDLTAFLDDHAYQLMKHVITKQYHCIGTTTSAHSLNECIQRTESIQTNYANNISNIVSNEKALQMKCIESAAFQYGKNKNESALTQDATDCLNSLHNNLSSKVKAFSSNYLSQLK